MNRPPQRPPVSRADAPTIAPLIRDSALPVYQQIKTAIAEKIRAGTWAPGHKMDSENELVATLQVSRMTVHRALRELQQEGLLRRVHGVGTFVAEPVRHASLVELKDIAQEIRAQGRTHQADVQVESQVPASREIAERLALTPGSPVFHVVLVHHQDRTPIQIEERYVNPAMAPDFLSVDFTHTTPTEYLVQLFRPDEMEHIVQATMADAQQQAQLAISPDEPCLRLLRRTWKAQRVVTSVSLLYPSSRYDLVARYTTDEYRSTHQ